MRNTRLVFLGDRRFEIVDEEVTPPGTGEAEIEVVAAGMCGSDVHGYLGSNDRRPPGTVMGHEVVGRVARIAAGADIAVGALAAVWPIVACGSCDLCVANAPQLCRSRRLYGCTRELPGGFATRMTVPVDNLVPLPAGVPAEWGALVEPLAVGYHAVRLAREQLGARVGVIGGGPIGIAVAVAARWHGAAEVVVFEPVEARRRKLAGLGFTAVPPEASPRDLATVFECVGLPATMRAAVEASRPGATVVCVGVAEPELTIPMVSLVIEERRLLGSSAHTRADFAAVADSLAGDVDLGALIEDRTDLAGAITTFARYAAGETSAIKTLVLPNG